MKTLQSRRRHAKVSHSRWLAYATASAATALAGSHSAEAAIHYSDPMNARFASIGDRFKFFRLAPNESIGFHHRFYSTNLGGAKVYAGSGYLSVRAGRLLIDSNFYVSRLAFGQNVSTGYFFNAGYIGVLAQAFAGNYSQWRNPGIGYLGFKFNNGAGIQYGWVRIRMGGAPQNAFVLLDYAYADPGEPIQAGQKSSDEQTLEQGSTDEQPDQGSLGGLALGAVGLLAWRKSRSRAARHTKQSQEINQ